MLIQAAPRLSVQAPIYDFKSSARVGYREVRVPDSRVVIIEGIYALSSRIRRALPPSVSFVAEVRSHDTLSCELRVCAMQQHC